MTRAEIGIPANTVQDTYSAYEPIKSADNMPKFFAVLFTTVLLLSFLLKRKG